MRTITIAPVTRIEGHAKITLHLDEQGRVDDARMHVTQVRGFEKFCEGRPYYEMPSLMARICGICPISHLLASAKACDALMAVRIPPAAARLRRAVHMAQFIQSHALSFFHLSSPDLLLGMDADPAIRNIVGVVQAHPELAKAGIGLRRYGQQVIEWLAGDRVHPSWIVPGGVNAPLTPAVQARIMEGLPEAKAVIQQTLDLFKSILDRFEDEIANFGHFPSLYMGLVDPRGRLELYDGGLRFMDAQGAIMHDHVPSEDYRQYIGEAVESWSYLKLPYYKPMGYPDGLYRVGPMARLNVADSCGTPAADVELTEYRQRVGRIGESSFLFHYARLIEALYAAEKLNELIGEEAALDPRVRAEARPNSPEGIGIAEAPRGTLIHHYRIDEQGLITWANLIIATGNNNLAINRSIKQVAQRYVDSERLTEGMLNRVEAVVRAYDPCLSCSTHAVGQMPLRIELHAADGRLLDTLSRDGA